MLSDDRDYISGILESYIYIYIGTTESCQQSQLIISRLVALLYSSHRVPALTLL